jgi:hypothetical protein
MAKGFNKLGILLAHQELEKIWRDITENNSRIEKFDFKVFKAFYDRYDMKLRQSNLK